MHTITTNYSLKWQIKGHDYYKVTAKGEIINVYRSRIVKRVLNGGSVGYWIAGKFYTLASLRSLLIAIPKQDYPF